MSQNPTDFNRGAIKPVECLREAWGLMKEQYWILLGICVVGMLVGSAFAIVLMGPMMCGIYLCMFQRMRNERVGFDVLFKGFDYFGQSVVATLIQMIPAVIIIVPTYLVVTVMMVAIMSSSHGGGSDAVAIGFVLIMVVFFLAILLISIVLGVFFAFTFPLIVDRKLTGVEAVRTSVRAAMANLGGVLGLVLLTAVLSFVGVLLCYVGAFFVLPIHLAAHAIAYRRVFPDIAPGVAVPPPPPASWAA